MESDIKKKCPYWEKCSSRTTNCKDYEKCNIYKYFKGEKERKWETPSQNMIM